MVDYIKNSFTNIVVGDSIQWNIVYAEGIIDITGWKIRCEIWNDNKQIKLANIIQTGGADDQIEITDGLKGEFSIKVFAGKTDGMRGVVSMEIEFEPPDGKVVTPLRLDFTIQEKKIDWENPTV